MRTFRFLSPWWAFSLLFAVALTDPVFPQDAFTEVVDEIPDLLQIDPEARFEGMGAAFCAPVAVSNSLVWMHRTGLASLLDPADTEKKAQIALVKSLASQNYMNTDVKKGTGPWGVLSGLDHYLKERKVSGYNLLYQGWRPHPKPFHCERLVPDTAWMYDILRQGGGVWLNVGWYTYASEKNQYKRIGGHWLTLVGYGEEEDGKPNPKMLILHDPGPRAGATFANEYVLCRVISSGTLTGDRKGLPRPAEGFHKLEGGMHVRRTADCAILDGVVALQWGSDPNG